MKAKSTKKCRQSTGTGQNNKHMKKYKAYWYIVEATQMLNSNIN